MGVNHFRRDDRDTRFVLFEHLDIDGLSRYDRYRDFSHDDYAMIIDEAMKVCREVLGPTLQDGDRLGCRFEGGRVTTPPVFREAWRVMAENGWIALPVGPEHGGQGLPLALAGQVAEMFTSANLALQIYAGLTVGAGHLIETFGSEADRALFCEAMYSGRWAGTMAMTEPDAGSDVGWLRTRAIPDLESGDDRVYRIEGTKCFISGGDHDLAENIVHLLLARIEGAPGGTRGISLFIVPRIWVNPDGTLGEPNDVACGGIEHKMGMNGSATCTLNFGEQGRCRGILLGEPNTGMAQMFQMMNEARLSCGTLALGLAAAAYDSARAYARERIQGPPFTDRRADRSVIIGHEDVRRMLLNLKSGTEAMRALISHTFHLLDVAEHDPDEDTRGRAGQRVELLTPVVKSWCSDFSYILTRDAIQVMGGVGYTREFPAEQYARDAKAISIYEGINYIQALDLIGRKMMMRGGQVFQDFLNGIREKAARHGDDPEFGSDHILLDRAAGVLADYAGRFVGYFGDGRMALIPLAATRFLDCFGETAAAELMLEQGLIARDRLAGVDPDSPAGVFYRGKMASVHFFCRNTLTQVFGRWEALLQEDLSAVEIPEAAF